jgi:hypothetical protein
MSLEDGCWSSRGPRIDITIGEAFHSYIHTCTVYLKGELLIVFTVRVFVALCF